MLNSLYYGALFISGVTALARRLRNGALVLCYHNVVPHDSPVIGDPGLHLSVDLFAAQIDWLKHQYSIVSLREVVARIECGRSVRGLAAITFDDGYAGFFTHAWPLLRNLGVPATMFIVAGAPSRPAAFWWDHSTVVGTGSNGARTRRLVSLRGDRDLILADSASAGVSMPPLPRTHLPAEWTVIKRAATAGLELGAHTYTHRTLPTLDDTDLASEIAAPAEIIHDRAGVQPACFSYPYGIWDARVRDAVRRSGFYGAVTLDYGLNPTGADPYTLRRMNVPATISAAALAGWAAGLRPRSASAA